MHWQNKAFNGTTRVLCGGKMRSFLNGMKDLGEVRVNWTAILGLGAALFVSVSFWAAVINTTASLVK